MTRASQFILRILQGQYLFVEEASPVAYGGDFMRFPDEKDLLRAHLVVELIERYRLAPEAIVVRSYIPLGHNGVEYSEVDIIAHDDSRNPFLIGAVETPEVYEQNKDEVLAKLFAVAVLLRERQEPRYLLYYTRWYEGETRKVRQLVIDCAKHRTFSAWKAAGMPILSDLPQNQKRNDES